MDAGRGGGRDPDLNARSTFSRTFVIDPPGRRAFVRCARLTFFHSSENARFEWGRWPRGGFRRVSAAARRRGRESLPSVTYTSTLELVIVNSIGPAINRRFDSNSMPPLGQTNLAYRRGADERTRPLP